MKNISIALYRDFLRNARHQHGWKPSFIHTSTNNNSNNILHCIWMDTITKRNFYHICPYQEDNSLIHNYLSLIKTLIKNNDISLDRIEWLYWLLRVQKKSLKLYKCIVGSRK